MRVGKDFIVDIISHLASLNIALSRLQFALVLGCSSKKLYKLIAAGRMPSYPIGSPIRLCPAVIADWLRDQKTEPKPCPRKSHGHRGMK
jgi:excisionase family DNA binding protein